jgi:hypothetical protein
LTQTRKDSGGAQEVEGETLVVEQSSESQICPKKKPQALSASLSTLAPLHVSFLSFLKQTELWLLPAQQEQD